MREAFVGFGIALTVATAGMTAHAHHSIAAVYDSSRQATIEGVITSFHFVNPHPFLTLEVHDDEGDAEEWRLEMDNRWELAAIGVAADTLKPGDRVLVTGSLARKETHSLYIGTLERPADGFRYEQVGGTPRITR